MISYITSMILPSWINFIVDHFWVISTSAIIGYFIGNEGGLWRASKRFLMIVTVATILIATGAFIKENLPDWAIEARQTELENRGWLWGSEEADHESK